MKYLTILILLSSIHKCTTNTPKPVDFDEEYVDTFQLMNDTFYLGDDLGIHFISEEIPSEMHLDLINDSLKFSFPVSGKLTSKYGWRNRSWHSGIDIGMNFRDTIYSTFDGTVRYSEIGYNGGYGNLIIIRHFNGLETYYGHCQKIFVQTGDTISSGIPIGLVGNSGRSTGPHLHFETRFLGKEINPMDIIDFSSDTLIHECIEIYYFNQRYIIKK